jgi:cytosine/creatinine deaminase
MNNEFFMNEALKEAKKGYKEGGIPIGAVLVKNNKIVGRGHNKRIQNNSNILHAEMDCLENAKRHSGRWYKNTIIYSTLSPCSMCSGAIELYGIKKIVIGENENFKGPEEYSKSKGIEIINLNSKKCKILMKKFINENPKLWNEDIGK